MKYEFKKNTFKINILKLNWYTAKLNFSTFIQSVE